MKKNQYSQALIEQLTKEGVDIQRMYRFLRDLNKGIYDAKDKKGPYTVPDINHPSIYNRRTAASLKMDAKELEQKLDKYGIRQDLKKMGAVLQKDGNYFLDESCLEKIGILLYPVTAYGVLNGGSASSYADVKKNKSLDSRLFEQYNDKFTKLSDLCKNQPKGITPAFIHPDGNPGYSFLLLKLRMLLIHKQRYMQLTGTMPDIILPAFQMTSLATHQAIMEALDEYKDDSTLNLLANRIGCSDIKIHTEQQPLMAAITHSSEGIPRKIFDRAYGKKDTGIAMPGGHGQNFEVLTPIYKQLHSQGIKFAWLGNIDNLGFTVDPVALALLALTGADAAFEESWRTPIDIKGGILVQDSNGKMTVADIGPAISEQEMLDLEAQGRPSLFNCGIGLFNLDTLVPMLDRIPYELPLRITDQDKDAGTYAQAEQVTWEIVGLLENPLFFAVEKSKRFLAAKMLMDMILTSIPPQESTPGTLGGVAHDTHRGLNTLLEQEYGLELKDGRWCIKEQI